MIILTIYFKRMITRTLCGKISYNIKKKKKKNSYI